MNPVASAPHRTAAYVLGLLISAGLVYAGYQLYAQNQRIDRIEQLTAARNEDIGKILGEVTRFRIEQRAESKGTAALLETLTTYAPMLVSARTPEPEYALARAQMAAVLRAFESVGTDAWRPVMDRIGELDPAKNFDELKWLLEATIVIDRKPGLELTRNTILGQRLPSEKNERKAPSARLRWHAADLLLRHDTALAQSALRQVLLTESSRGINPDRAAAYGVTIPDVAAVATTGFHNFIVHYVRSGDSKIDETLLMVMGRTEHDLITVQECVKALGNRKCADAVDAIERLYQKPPGHSHNPLFQVRCLDSLASIQGEQARPFFEKMLPNATTDTVAKHLKRLLSAPIESKTASVEPKKGK